MQTFFIWCISLILFRMCNRLSSCLSSTSLAGCYLFCKGQYRRSLFLGVVFFFWTLYCLLNILCPVLTTHQLESSPSRSSQTWIPPPSVCQCLNGNYSLLFPSLCSCKPSKQKITRFRLAILLLLLLAGDIESNPGPVVISSDLTFSCLNVRSASSITNSLDKPCLLQEFISDYSIDLFALTETWFQPNTPANILNSITPPNYSIIHAPRKHGKGGGIAVVHRNHLKITTLSLPTFSSFESLYLTLSVSSFTCKLLFIYRPPHTSVASFLDEFSTLLSDLITSPSEVLIAGDFNIHVDDPSASYSSPFLTLLESFGLHQHIKSPTHECNHTLDLLITRSESKLVSQHYIIDPILSDHYAIFAKLSIKTTPFSQHCIKTFRSLHKIDVAKFSKDLFLSPLHTSAPENLSDYFELFKSTLSSLLDMHAPLKSVKCSSKIRKPFITPEILKEKSSRSRLEKIYRRTKSSSDLEKFKAQSRRVAKMVTEAKRKHFTNLISNSSSNPRKLWSSLNSLLSRSPVSRSLPYSSSSSSLASSFMQFFSDKILKLKSNIISDSISPHCDPISLPPALSQFSPATEAEVRSAILHSSDSTCALDIIPTKLLKSCLDALLLPITNLINLSLKESTIHPDFKHALITPLLKKDSLPKDDLSSYRPISNLNFISKILERIILNRLLGHLSQFPSFPSCQSAYRKFHSVESALLKIQNDLLIAIDRKQISALVLLDMSAAFDTVDHRILLDRLTRNFGINDSALNLLSSYLLDRTQSVVVDTFSSPPALCNSGVPQGSVLGPLLFTLYTAPLSDIISSSSIAHHMFADDTQLYISFSANDSAGPLSVLSQTLDSVHRWLSRNRLSLNPSKTEFLLIGNNQQREKLTFNSFNFSGSSIPFSTSARNLGVLFDSALSFENQISSVCKSSYFQIRQIRQIRSSLDLNSAVLLANSLVTSRLDFCNSLYCGLPACSIKRLQLVQNSLARAVVPSVRKYDHISSVLRQLHWLPVERRITFKLATVTYKVLHNKSPSYLSDLLIPYKSSRNLRSNSQNLLSVPRINSAMGRRSFSYMAPHLWNSLPLELKTSPSLISFRSSLKTYLFPP